MGAYGAGGLANNLLAAGSGGMMIALNLGYGMNPALVGLLGALPRLTDAITDPVMGHISDHTRSRWGRRRPYIFVGALVAPLLLALLWQLPEGRSESFYFNYFLDGSLIFYLGYTVFATPWVALGYELTPDYNERTRLMGVQNFIAQFAWVVAPWFLLFMELPVFGDMRQGAAALAIALAVVCAGLGILPALLLRERHTVGVPPKPQRSVTVVQRLVTVANAVFEFVSSFGKTLGSFDFRMLCGATFLVFNGFQLVAAFQSYVVIFYVFAGDQNAAAYWIGLAGTVSAGHGLGGCHLLGHPVDDVARYLDRQATRLLRLHRRLHHRIRTQMVLLRPGQSVVAAAAGAAHGLRTRQPVHPDGVHGGGRLRPGRIEDR